MKISKIKINNIRQYAGENEINLSLDSKKNMNILEAENGGGKTNLFNALIWCIYGEEPDINKEENEGAPLISESVLAEMEPGETAKALVSITLSNPRPKYSFRRYKKFRKENDGWEVIEEGFVINEKTKKGWSPVPEERQKDKINSLLPEKIKDFYFFNGEELDNYFKPGSKRDVKDTIFNVSQIDLLEDTILHIDSVQDRVWGKYEGEAAEKVKDLNQEIQKGKKKKEGLDEHINNLRDEVQSLRKEKNKIDNQLSQEESVKDLQKEREDLEKEWNSRSEREDEILNKMKGTIVDNLPLVFAKSALSNCLEEINRMDEEFGLPPDVKEPYIRLLLDTGSCICGSSLKEGTEERKKVAAMLDEEPSNRITEISLDGKYVIPNILEKAGRIKEKIENLNKNLTDIEDRKEDINDRTEEISNTLKSLSSSLGDKSLQEIENLEEKRENIDQHIQENLMDIGSKQEKKKTISSDIETTKEERQRLQEKLNKNEDLGKKLTALKKAGTLLKTVKKDIMNDVRSKTEELTERYFFNLIWKDTFQEVRIGKSYSVKVINRHGTNIRSNLSAGERQALALAFMAALKRVSGYDFPIIIDTPLGRISGTPRENIGENLPKYLKDSQITLLVTDTEYEDTFKQKVVDRVGAEYKIEFNQAKSVSKVIEK